ncbi:hypothetical protein EsH8_V_000859 [Colletotrichum jinshuiense]
MVVAILQLIPGLSTTGKFTTIIPLTIFVFLVIAKEGYYDWKRYRADVSENSRPVCVIRDVTSVSKSEDGNQKSTLSHNLDWISTSWDDIHVGDIVKLSRNEDVPADIVLLYASGENGLAYVETMALDGETNLKPKHPPANIIDCSTIKGIFECPADFYIEEPNADFYRFDSTVTANGCTIPMKAEEVIYRGSTIRNTSTVYGIAVNTGEECKIRMNAKQTTEAKKPALEGATNHIVICLVLYVTVISTVLTILYNSWKGSTESKAWYISGGTVPFQEVFLGFVIMFNQVIPLSLYIGLEAIKLCQASLVYNDLSLYDEETDTPAGVNNTNNLDDLGQISYVFTDKTETNQDCNNIQYEGSSPDEVALVKAAKDMGFIVTQRSSQSHDISIDGQDRYGFENDVETGINLQSYASRTVPSEPIDSLIPQNNEEEIQRCVQHIDDFAAEGLRTLIYADKVLQADEYEEWKKSFVQAEISATNRQERIEEVSEIIEQSLNLLGASAVEDKLQKGVPETIDKLRRANVKICMLTGDKRETAINIAHSTRICGLESSISVLDATEGNLELQLTNLMTRIEGVCQDSDCSESLAATHTAVVVDGATLNEIEQPSATHLRQLFYHLAPSVDSIICCRASPSQKSLMIKMIHDGPPPLAKASFFPALVSWFKRPRKPLTLAIGDGANDVPMIMTASVGVGISGKEGQQAARVADFSISQFRYLGRLMLVHGRYNYHRTAMFILTTFWKEMFIFLPQALFQEECGFAGTSLYHSTALIFISILTGASMIIIGTWEKDLNASTLLAIPELYAYGQKGEALNMKVFLGWMVNAAVAGIVAFRGSWLGYVDTELVRDNGLYAQGTMTFVICIIWINYKILIIEMHHKTKVAIWAAIASIAGLWAFHLIAAAATGASVTPYSVKNGFTAVFGQDAAWWTSLIWVLGMLMLVESTLRSFKQNSMIRTLVYRCWPFEKKKATGGGVREGFQDWEPRLWQEMETDPAVVRILENPRKH